MPEFLLKMSHFGLEIKDKQGNDSFTRAFDEAARLQIRQAARAFVRVAAASVPFRTGFARGVFRNILEAVGTTGRRPGGTDEIARLLGGIRGGPVAKHFPKLFTLTKGGLKAAGASGPFEYYTGSGGRVLKTPQSGRQFATPPGEIFKEHIKGVYTFNFNVTISYFDINDFKANPRTPSSPWQAFARGQATFINYMNTIGISRLPQVMDFLIEYAVTTSGKAVNRTRLGRIGRGTRLRF